MIHLKVSLKRPKALPTFQAYDVVAEDRPLQWNRWFTHRHTGFRSIDLHQRRVNRADQFRQLVAVHVISAKVSSYDVGS
jgi:hypothetical protein